MDKQPKARNPIGSVLVVGGGIAGIQASLDLAESGFKVYLIDEKPSIGGHMAALDKTFPTNDCATCIVAPKLVEVDRHPSIELLTLSELQGLEGEPGHFRIKIRRHPRYVREELCTGCGICWEKCPVKDIPSDFNQGLGTRAAIYVNSTQAIPLVPVLDASNCRYIAYRNMEQGIPHGEKPRSPDGKRMPVCRICEKLCPQGAVDFDQPVRDLELEVGAIILSGGYDLFNPEILGEYGYHRYPNVLTSLEFERMLSASGPFGGNICRLSDRGEPKKIAFIQCVGSRNLKLGNDYCSSVCCMYSTKEAIVAKEHHPHLESTIFYIDLRAYGKGFHRYIQRAQEEYGVRYVRCNVSSISQRGTEKTLVIQYITEEGKPHAEEFDLVVLAVGIKPSRSMTALCGRLDIAANRFGFCKTVDIYPVDTSRQGIYACGTFTGPKDIPQTVIEASAAAARASELLAPSRNTLIHEMETPVESELSPDECRIGAFVCHCGSNIAGVIDIKKVVDRIGTVPNVLVAEDGLHLCAPDSQARIKELIQEHQLNRILVAACSPRTHETLFQKTLVETGLNKYLFEMTNIRDQCSLVHMKNPDRATDKATTLMEMGLRRSEYLKPLYSQKFQPDQRVLVVGGGLAGMTAALSLSYQGFEVHLVEKEAFLGGNLRHLFFTLRGTDIQEFLESLTESVMNDPRIQIHTQTEVGNSEGCIGNFVTTLKKKTPLLHSQEIPGDLDSEKSEEIQLRHGVTIVATGAAEAKGNPYLQDWDDKVLTQRELEYSLAKDPERIRDIRNIVIIQCVGSRNSDRPYCSKVCCNQALKNALKVKEINPETNVYMLYQDMMSYGLKEEYYSKARQAGIHFIRFHPNNPPVVRRMLAVIRKGQSTPQEESPLVVSVLDANLNEKISLTPDLLVLSVAIQPSQDNPGLAKLFKVPLDSDGFFLEAHMKLRPVDFATDGIFVCGLAHSPMSVEETIAQAYAVASRAGTIISKTFIESEAMLPQIDPRYCTGCAVCQSSCPFQAIQVIQSGDGQRAEVILAACKGCGVCGAACPYLANSPAHFTDQQLMAQIEVFASAKWSSIEPFEPKILGFLCNWCAYAGADLAGVSRVQYQPNFHAIRVMCTGRIDMKLVIEALRMGIDGVMVLGCHPGDCHYSAGNVRAQERITYLKHALHEIGVDSNRVLLDWVSASEGNRFAHLVNTFTDNIRVLGPIFTLELEPVRSANG